GVALREDLRAAGIEVVAVDPDQPLRLAELRTTTNLRLPDCCVLDVAVPHRASLATFDDALTVAARARGVSALP
ncbi:MAG: PIN domain-containing protein, partial [Actinobacteria bacterium]|nr:PIN domain-containing protein [Actinomycetota bacterium]